MLTHRINASLKANMVVVVPLILVLLIIIFGGIGVYLAEHEHQGANITNLGNAFWWAVETITTVGYGDYTPVTIIGRIIAIFVMFSNWYRCGSFRYAFPEKIAACRIKV
jgi:voltage-gated potassium channel